MLTIQLGHPKINQLPAQELKQVREAFLKLFHPLEESIYVFWNGIPIRLRYQEDMYHSFEEILAMTWLVQKEVIGRTKATLTSQLLKAELRLLWKDDMIEIRASFTPFEELYKPFSDALNARNSIKMAKHEFLAEWKMILHQIIVSLKAGNISIEDGKERRKLELIQHVEKNIPGYGKLYTR